MSFRRTSNEGNPSGEAPFAPNSTERVIAVNRFYAPDYSPTAQLLTDLAEHLAARGVEVVIVTSRQRYDDARADLPPVGERRGVKVRRVWTSRFGRCWLPGRAIDYASFYLAALVALLRLARPGDTILVKTDPPLISIVAWLAAKLRGARLVNWCQDLFPETAAVLGLGWAAGPVGHGLRRLRNGSLKAATMNVVLCGRMAARLAVEGVPRERITLIHNWADGGLIRPIPPEQNPLRREWGLVGRRVIGYSGNLGRAHDLPGVQAFIAAMTAADPELVFLFVGGGAGGERLTNWVQAHGLSSVLFRPYQPRERLAESLSVPDLHLVSLAPACEGLIMPSKLYGILAAGRPVIAVSDPRGAVAELVRGFGVGVVWERGREEEVLRTLKAAQGESRIRAIRRVFEREFDRLHALQRWRVALAADALPTVAGRALETAA
jgi:hypothetical protein